MSLVEAGAIIYCLDLRAKPTIAFHDAQKRLNGQFGGSLSYRQADVKKPEELEDVIASIAA